MSRDGSIQELGQSDFVLVEAIVEYLSNLDSTITYCRRTSISWHISRLVVVVLRVPLKVKL